MKITTKELALLAFIAFCTGQHLMCAVCLVLSVASGVMERRRKA